ncbi:MAG: hypothetical protein A4E57_04692 [Syntrophorhabdaceae bacterium PtaU1.Bin034]|nr:MAG: hypothetical protein A4E57_04692 [Syntrophorhabdaceae bacterium PtaU1.Bin034]
MFQPSHFPMLRHLAEPLHAGVFVGGVGFAGADVDLAGDGLVDERLLVLLQQLDQLLLGADRPPYPPVHVIQKAHDGGLLGEGWEGYRRRLDSVVRKPVTRYPLGFDMKLVCDRRTLKGTKQECAFDHLPWAQKGQMVAGD